ncbi:unnamed protein product [Soboliphyme baturini]|uniref:Leishmanolysin-like peptidase n=1 Tax=Soboliphyme baturini TaxID=241478 RepID=A0A183IHK3_9BILA|nr:unnamed protein product [Soboliphyme baturini]
MKTTCSVNRDSLALCHLIEYQEMLPAEYQNFDHLDGVPEEALVRYGGSVELADYCPYPQEFEWKNAENNQRDSRCSFTANAPGEFSDRHSLKLYTFDSPGTKWCSGGHFCQEGRLWLSLLNGTSVYPCYKAGQLIMIRQVLKHWLHSGTIVCPACAELCENCVSETEPPHAVGDEPKQLICGAETLFFCRSLFIPVLLYLYFLS